MQKTKPYTTILAIIIFAGILILSPVSSLLMESAVISSTGRISTELHSAYANSGSASDIQAAVNWVVGHGGIGNVYVPEGTFNFVEEGESWTGAKVTIPAGVNVFGATTERDANDQVVEWKTILVMPWDVPSDRVWFSIEGAGNENTPTRFSDIKLQGYRSINPSSVTLHRAIAVDNVRDFRIDHCAFEHTTDGILIWGLHSRGVIDHCRLYNIYGFDDLVNSAKSTVCYGVDVGRGFYSEGYESLSDVLGKYTDHTVFVEDCYFSKWRHCVSPGHGAHIVFRYNVINQDYGHFSLDVHGLRDSGTDRWGTRCAEFYENTLTNCNITDNNPEGSQDFRNIFQNGGGSGVWFNNYIDSSYRSDSITLYSEDAVSSTTWHLKDFYLWSTKGPWTPGWNGIPSGFTADRNVEADWSRQAGNPSDANYPNVDPTWSIAGYEPYTYPHPLTQG